MTDGKNERRLLWVMLAASAILPVGWLIKLATTSEHLFPDFFALWSFGGFVLTHPASSIYDDKALHLYQMGLGLPQAQSYPFSYPPWILLFLAPLGALPYALAEGIWLAITFAGYAAALAAWRWSRLVMALLCAAPSSAVCVLVGQNGFLTGALILGGIRLLWTRPLLAGALLASAAYKPQFALLVPFILLFGGHRRAILGAVLATALLSLATSIAFGLNVWSACFMNFRSHAETLTAGRGALLDMMPTLTSAAMQLGASKGVIRLIELGGVVLGVTAVWRMRRRKDPQAQSVTALAMVLAAPYAFYYDLPVITGAALAVVDARTRPGQTFAPLEFPALLGCVLSPMILIARPGAVSIVVPVILALSLLVLSRTPSPFVNAEASAGLSPLPLP